MVDPRRLFPAVAIGGAVTGFVLAIPMLGDVLRCALCVGVMAGSLLSMKLWLDSHLAENLSAADAALLGACSGGVTGGVSWFISVPIRLVFGADLASFFMNREFLPELLKDNLRSLYTSDFASILVSLPLEIMVYGIMGALGGFLSIQYVFRARLGR
jgi:hypothetical protein